MGTSILIQMSVDDFQNYLTRAIAIAVDDVIKSKQITTARTKISREEVALMINLPDPDYVYRLTSKKVIPFHKVGKALIFYKEEIQAYIDSQRIA
jgi:excisionase family DNA binding protein